MLHMCAAEESLARINQTDNSFEADNDSIPRVARSRPGAETVLLPAEEQEWPRQVSRPPPPAGAKTHLVLNPADEAVRKFMEDSIAAYVPGGQLQVIVTDNRYTMISVKRDRGMYRMRMHHMFLEGGAEIIRALGLYVSANDRESSVVLSSFIDANQTRIRRGRRARVTEVTLETRGEYHDLGELYSELNGRYFNDTIEARITWGQRALQGAKKRRRNSIKMGSYSVEDRLIRIHPSLDRPFVPRYFVAWIVYHEMLHQKHDIPVVDGRRQFHTPAFLAEERLFDEFERAQQWERVHLNRLLVY